MTEVQNILIFRRARTKYILIHWHLLHFSILSVKTRHFAVSIDKDSGSCPWHCLPQPSDLSPQPGPSRTLRPLLGDEWWWPLILLEAVFVSETLPMTNASCSVCKTVSNFSWKLFPCRTEKFQGMDVTISYRPRNVLLISKRCQIWKTEGMTRGLTSPV